MQTGASGWRLARTLRKGESIDSDTVAGAMRAVAAEVEDRSDGHVVVAEQITQALDGEAAEAFDVEGAGGINTADAQ